MDNNDYSSLKIDTTSSDDVSKLAMAMNDRSYRIFYDEMNSLTNAITNNTISINTSPYTHEDLTWTTDTQRIYTTYTYPITSYKETINKKDLSRFMRDISLVLLDAANGKDLTQVLETMSTYFAAYADAIENDTKYEESETE